MRYVLTVLVLGLVLVGGKAEAQTDTESGTCFVKTLCEVKERVRWRTPAWDEATCQEIGQAFLTAAKKHDFEPEFLLAFALNESELSDKALRETRKSGQPYAHDSGLMGVRCMHGPVADTVRGKQVWTCKNGALKGYTLDQVRDPATNVALGAQILANIRDNPQPCAHKTHPWWAHYNWGPRSFDEGRAKHYPHRVAVLWRALTKALDKPLAELDALTFPKAKGEKARAAAHPVGTRQRRLYAHIAGSAGLCRVAKGLAKGLGNQSTLASVIGGAK